MKYNIRPYWASYNEPILFTVNIKNKDFNNYYNEIWRRFWEFYNLKTEEQKQEYLKTSYICDIDEVSIWDMSTNTLQDYIKFITK